MTWLGCRPEYQSRSALSLSQYFHSMRHKLARLKILSRGMRRGLPPHVWGRLLVGAVAMAPQAALSNGVPAEALAGVSA
jgi:hypothetical protein